MRFALQLQDPDGGPSMAAWVMLLVFLVSLTAAAVGGYLRGRKRYAQWQRERKVIAANCYRLTQAIDRIFELEAENDELRAGLENAFSKAHRPLPPELARQDARRQHLHAVSEGSA